MHTLLLSTLVFTLPAYTSAFPRLTVITHDSRPPSSPNLLAPWILTDFHAYTSPSMSWASFTFTDTSTDNTLMLNCSIPPSNSSIYLPKMTPCGEKMALLFRIGETEVVLRRTWRGKHNQWVTGIAPQGTYWMGGEGGNVTSVNGEKMYTRTTKWHFPIETMIG